MRKLLIAVVAILALALLGSGLFFRLPTPEIVLAAEEIVTVGGIEITNAIITAWIVVILISVVTWWGTRTMRVEPSGLQNFIEWGLEMFLGLVERVAGEKNGRKFFPLVATILIYVLVSNWFGLLPGVGTIGEFHEQPHGAVAKESGGLALIMPNPDEVDDDESYLTADGTLVAPHEEGADTEAAPPGEETAPSGEEAGHGAAGNEAAATLEDEGDLLQLKDNEKLGVVVPYLRPVATDLNATLAIAIVAIVFVQIWGSQELGFRGYFSKFFNFRRLRKGEWVNGGIDVFVGFLEIVSEMARMISFTFRLFGNVFAGEVLLVIMSFLMPFLIILPFYGLELFVGFIQAFVFAMLTLVFGAVAVVGHGDHDEHDGHDDHGSEVPHTPMAAAGAGGQHT